MYVNIPGGAIAGGGHFTLPMDDEHSWWFVVEPKAPGGQADAGAWPAHPGRRRPRRRSDQRLHPRDLAARPQQRQRLPDRSPAAAHP